MVDASLDTLLSQLSSSFSPEAVDNVNLSIQLNIHGENGGDWYVTIKDKERNLAQGIAESPDFTLGISSEDFKELTAGRLNPAQAFMSGRLKFSGNMMAAMKLSSLLTRKEF